MCWWPAHVFSMTCPRDRAEPKWNNVFKCYLSFVIDVYQNSEGYASQSISQEKNHNVLPLFYGTEKKNQMYEKYFEHFIFQLDHMIKLKDTVKWKAKRRYLRYKIKHFSYNDVCYSHTNHLNRRCQSQSSSFRRIKHNVSEEYLQIKLKFLPLV